MNQHTYRFLMIVSLLLFFLLAAYTGYLHVQIRKLETAKSEISNLPTLNTPDFPLKTVDTNGLSEFVVDYSAIYDKIKEATATLTARVDALANASPKTTVITNTTSSTGGVKEYYIPLGYGSTNSTSWIELPGVEAYLAPANYGKITGFYFEAGIRIPTGNGRVYARIKNVTDNVGLFESEVYRDGTSTGLISSGKIPIPTTTKLYRVELKSSLGVEVVLDNARLKIFVQ